MCGFSSSLSFLPSPYIAFLQSLNVVGTNHKQQKVTNTIRSLRPIKEALIQISGQHVVKSKLIMLQQYLCLSLMTSGPLTFVGLSGNGLCPMALTQQRGSCHIHINNGFLLNVSENGSKFFHFHIDFN